MKSNRWLTVLFSILIIFTLGCGFFTRLFPGKGTALSTEPPTLPAPPKPSLVITGTPEEQAIYFADLLSSPETRLAGWLGLYDALGVPIIGQDGKSLGSTDDDPIGPRYWEIWYASGLDKKGRGIPISDAGRLVAAGSPGSDGAALGTALLNDLKLAVKSSDPQVRLMGLFVRERIKRWPSHLDIEDAGTKPEDAIVDLPTVQMITWIALRGELFKAFGKQIKPVGTISRPKADMMMLFQKSAPNPASQLPCSEKLGDGDSTYWTNWLVNKVIAGGVKLPGMENAFTGLLEKMQRVDMASEATIKKTGSVITQMNVAAVLLSLLLQIAAMEIEPSQKPAPLVRTKSTNRGDKGAIELQLYSAPDKIPDGNNLGACVGAYFMNAFGVSFSFPAKGPIAGAEMTVSGGVGFPDLVLFNSEGTNSMRRWTDKSGVAEYKLFGAPQKRQIPETAKEQMKEFSVHVKAQPEESGLNSMLNIFFGGLTFGTAPSKAGGFGSAIDIAKGFQYDMGEYFFDLKDWKQKGYRASGGTADVKYSGVICDLEKPFTIIGTYPSFTARFKFVPSSATAGTASYVETPGVQISTGKGTYTIEGSDNDLPTIMWSVSMNTVVPGVGSHSAGGTAPIQLIPLETDECGGE